MELYDSFRNTYRNTRNCVETDDCSGVVLGCRKLAALCGKLYKQDNGTKLQAKASLKQHAGNFAALANTVESSGIDDQVRTFFGFAISKPILAEAPKTIVDEKPKYLVATYDPTDHADFAISEMLVKEKPQKSNEILLISENSHSQEAVDIPSGVAATHDTVGEGAENVNCSPMFDPETLDAFIGQKEIIKRIRIEINAAKKLGRNWIEHTLLFGNRGLGKTTLMKLIAKALGVGFEYIDCSQFRNDVSSQRAVQNFFQRIGRANKPVLIGMDEIHEFPKRLQSGLLTLLNNRRFVYMDNNGTNHSIPIDHFTFVGATTDPQEVLATVKDRCNLTFFLSDYSRDELRQIFLNKFASKELWINEDVLNECINRCRSSVREVNAIVRGLETLAVIADTNIIDADMTLEHFQTAGVDPIGLKIKDIEILNTLNESEFGVMAEGTIASRSGLESKIYSSEYEPYLIKIGFISINGKGRALTEKAKTYLKKGAYNYGESNIKAKQMNEREVPEKKIKNGKDNNDPIDDLT